MLSVERVKEQSPEPVEIPAERARQLRVAQLDLLGQLGVWHQAGLVAMGGLLFWQLADAATAATLDWFLAMTVAAALAQAGVERLRRAYLHTGGEPTRWLLLFSACSLLAGIAWGGAACALVPSLSAPQQALIGLVVLGQAMLSVAAGVWYLPCLVSFLVPALLPTALAFLSADGPARAAIGGAALLFMVLLLGVGLVVNRRYWASVAKQLEDHDHIERLLTGRACENAVQQWLETALESMSEALAVFDADDRLVLCNSRFLGEQRAGRANNIVGIDFEALVRRDIHKAGIVRAQGRVEEYIAERLAYHRSKNGVFVIELADGRWLQVRELPMRGGGTVVVQTDITAYKGAEVKLRAAKEKAEHANRSKSELLANTSHELRTPLNAIIGFSEIMEGQMFGPLGNERYTEYARDIRKSGEYLVKVIDDLLDLSKIEAGRQDPADDVVDIGRLVATAVNITQTQARNGGLSVLTEIPGDLPRLRADQRMVQQVLLNLMSNAIKFTPAGGEVRVSALLDSTGDLLLKIADSGIGMSAEDMERAFEPFGRAKGAMIRNFEGTGLGLPLSRSLINLHGGMLELESEPNVGTIATVRFPAQRLIGRRPAVDPSYLPEARLSIG